MEWGSFLLGGLVFGAATFVLGLVLGIQTQKAEQVEKWLKFVISDLRERMKKDETVRVEFAISRYICDDGDDDDDNETPTPPMEPDRAGTEFWNNQN